MGFEFPSRQADEWLTKFQQTPAAWQVSDQLLSSSETCQSEVFESEDGSRYNGGFSWDMDI